jgi:hypothetical protein
VYRFFLGRVSVMRGPGVIERLAVDILRTGRQMARDVVPTAQLQPSDAGVSKSTPPWCRRIILVDAADDVAQPSPADC